MGVDISVFCIYIGVDPQIFWEVQESIDTLLSPNYYLPTSWLQMSLSIHSGHPHSDSLVRHYDSRGLRAGGEVAL